MTQVNYHLEFDVAKPTAGVREVLVEVAAKPPFPSLRLLDRRGRFAFARALFDNQREMREAGVPTVVLVISAFMHFFVVPVVMVLVWLFTLPDRLFSSGLDSSASDVQQFLAASDRPTAVTALPFIVQELSDRLNWTNVVLSTFPVEAEPTDGESTAPRVRLSATELGAADESRLLELVGSRIEVQP